jgi:hypothetical protein
MKEIVLVGENTTILVTSTGNAFLNYIDKNGNIKTTILPRSQHSAIIEKAVSMIQKDVLSTFCTN